MCDVKKKIVYILLFHVAAFFFGSLQAQTPEVYQLERDTLASSPESSFKNVDEGSGENENCLTDSVYLAGQKNTSNEKKVVLQRGKPGFRHDRGINQFLFIPKKAWMFGCTATYKSYDSDDSQMFSFLKDFNFNGEMLKFTPYIGYMVRNNMAVGVKLGYQRVKGNLGNISVDLGEDLDFGLSDLKYNEDMFNLMLFHRSYVGLDRGRRFGVFNETFLAYNWGSNRFVQDNETQSRDTQTDVQEVHVGIKPGLCVFIMNNVSFEFSVGVAGFKYRKEKQRTNNIELGEWRKSGANFKINIFDINMGIIVYL